VQSVILSAGAFATTVAVAGYAALCLVALAVRSRHLVVSVAGTSMTPGYLDGDRVLVRRGSSPLKVGAVVVLRAPKTVLACSPEDEPDGQARPTESYVRGRATALAGTVRDVVDRAAVVPAGALAVLSDAPGGTDSRRWGFVQADAVIGTAVRKLPAATGEESLLTGGEMWQPALGGICARQRSGAD
jgi:signal peptidase I